MKMNKLSRYISLYVILTSIVFISHCSPSNEEQQALRKAISYEKKSYEHVGDKEKRELYDSLAIDAYTNALQYRKLNAKGKKKAYLARGYLLFSRGDYGSAIQDFNRLIDIDRESTEGYYLLGLAYQKIGNNSDALDNLNKAIKIDPNIPSIYRERGQVYKTIGEHDRAINDFLRDIKKKSSPSKRITHEMLGDTYVELNQMNNAIESYNNALTIIIKNEAELTGGNTTKTYSPEKQQVLEKIGVVYEKMGKPKKAKEAYKRAKKESVFQEGSKKNQNSN